MQEEDTKFVKNEYKEFFFLEVISDLLEDASIRLVMQHLIQKSIIFQS